MLSAPTLTSLYRWLRDAACRRVEVGIVSRVGQCLRGPSSRRKCKARAHGRVTTSHTGDPAGRRQMTGQMSKVHKSKRLWWWNTVTGWKLRRPLSLCQSKPRASLGSCQTRVKPHELPLRSPPRRLILYYAKKVQYRRTRWRFYVDACFHVPNARQAPLLGSSASMIISDCQMRGRCILVNRRKLWPPPVQTTRIDPHDAHHLRPCQHAMYPHRVIHSSGADITVHANPSTLQDTP